MAMESMNTAHSSCKVLPEQLHVAYHSRIVACRSDWIDNTDSTTLHISC